MTATTPLTWTEVRDFRQSLKIGDTKTIGGFVVSRVGVMTYTLNGEKVVGAGTLQDEMVRLSNRKPHDAGRESDLPERLRP